MAKTAVLFHSDADGFGAAFAIWLERKDKDTMYVPVQYGQPFPELPKSVESVYIVDFSYDRETCMDLAKKYKFLRILDHHKSAEEELKGLPFTTFSGNESGCVMAWKEFHGGKPVPDILNYVQDRDLWRFELPNSEEVNLYIASLGFHFEVWKYHMDDKFYPTAHKVGAVLKRFRKLAIDDAVSCARMMRLVFDWGTFEVPVVNCSSYTSETCHALLEKYPDAPFSAAYYDGKDVRYWSLRSRGEFDVSIVAKYFGGGGHAAASGFYTEIGWPQYDPDEFIEAFEEKVKEEEANETEN